MPATTFEVHVAIDTKTLWTKFQLAREREAILTSFEAALDHWIAEQRLELKP